MVGNRRAGIGGDAIGHGEAGNGGLDRAHHELDHVAVAEPCAERADVLRLGRAGEDAQADGFYAALFPIHFAQVFGEAFGEAVEGIGAVGLVGVDAAVGFAQAHGVDRGGIDHAAEAVAVGRFPDVIGADVVGAEQLFEGLFIDDGAEVDHHVGAFEERLDSGEIGDIGLNIGLVRGEAFGGLADIGADKLAGHLGKRRAQLVAEVAARAGEDEFVEHSCSPSDHGPLEKRAIGEDPVIAEII